MLLPPGTHDALLSWRAIILYGLNTATYNIALGRSLEHLARTGRDRVTVPELAAIFFDLYHERLRAGNRPQLSHPNRLTVMERVIALYDTGKIDREEATARVAAGAFGDVAPRFHTVGDSGVPVRFYVVSSSGLVLTDATFQLFAQPNAESLGAELGARWDLLEAAFSLKREGGQLANDLRLVYLEQGYARRSVTHLRAVLHGYQQGRCFYCRELIPLSTGHVDHVIPRQFVQHDEPWNLVLAHALCNEQKSDLLPSERSIAMLVARNEHLIASNHPLKQQFMAQLGQTPDARRRAVLRTYEDAKQVMPYTWGQVWVFDPATDVLYQTVIRRLAQ